MSNIEQLEQRVEAVENAVTHGKTEFEDIKEVAELTAELESMAKKLEKMEQRLAAVEGATQSLEGYVGNVKSVNSETEKQADAAVAAVDRLESKIETFERQVSVEAFESLAQQVEELNRDQQRLAAELSKASGTTGEFVFGDQTGGPEPSQNGHPKSAVSTNGSAPTDHANGSAPTDHANGSAPTDHANGSAPTDHANGSAPTDHANGSRPIDPAASAQNRHRQSERDDRLPPQQQRVDKRYGTTSDGDDEQPEEKGAMAKLLESLPDWMTK
ncbi:MULTISPECIES: DUF7310 family coiled-coil domain-containing protein [Haloarcula]|uniref:DUF7310 family coiled-coil domain-containing protein n=1 Tax=Haloarcula TaxID=2237 RepID=UPI0023E85E07|nr:hypothetical protein [Halomicroarcula sp. SHR3]